MTEPKDLDEVLKRLERIENRLSKSIETTRRVERRLYSQLESLVGLYRDIDGLPSLPPLRGWALSPDTARELYSLVDLYRPQHVVECGSGSSTVLLAHLRASGLVGKVTSLEHEPVYFESTRQRLRASGVLDQVELLFTPLTRSTIDGEQFLWYEIDLENLSPIDLLVVDGPPSTTQPQARYPAIPLLLDNLADGCLVFVDDYQRADDSEVVERWQRDFGLRSLRVNRSVEKALAVLEFRVAIEEQAMSQSSHDGDEPR